MDDFITKFRREGKEVLVDQRIGSVTFRGKIEHMFEEKVMDDFSFKANNAIKRYNVWTSDQKENWINEETEFGSLILKTLFTNEAAKNSLVSGVIQSQGELVGQSPLFSEQPTKPIKIVIWTVDNFISRIPWELCLAANLSEVDSRSLSAKLVVARTSVIQFDKTWEPPAKLRILVLGTNLISTTNQEFKAIEDAFSKISPSRFEINYKPTTDTSTLPGIIEDNRPHIIHLSTHGSEGGESDFQDLDGVPGSVSAIKLNRLIPKTDSLLLFITTACSSGRSSKGELINDIGFTFSNSGIPAVISMQFNITPESAFLFSEKFYYGIANSNPLFSAFVEARDRLFSRRHGSPEWAAPVLYIRQIQDEALLSKNVKTYLSKKRDRLQEYYQAIRDAEETPSVEVLKNTLQHINSLEEELLQKNVFDDPSPRVVQSIPSTQELSNVRKPLRRMITLLKLESLKGHEDALVEYSFEEIHEEFIVHLDSLLRKITKAISIL